MVKRHRIDFLIANRIRNPLFTKVSRDIYLPRQTEIPQPRPDVRPSEESEIVGSAEKPGVYNVCTPCDNKISCNDNYSPNNPYITTAGNNGCSIGLASFFQLIESEGVTGDTGDSPWCESHTYCFSQETDETTPNYTSYALIRAKATGQAIKNVNDGENMGTVILSDSKDDYQPKPWQSISCQIDGWYVY